MNLRLHLESHPVSGPLVDLCDRFEDALRRGDRPELAKWLVAAGPHAATALYHLAALELYYRLAAGEPVTAADYFAAHPELRSDRETAVRLVAIEFRVARTRYPAPTEAEFHHRYPDLADGQEWSNGPWATLPQESPGIDGGTSIQPPGSLPPSSPPQDLRTRRTDGPHPAVFPHSVPNDLRTILEPPHPAHPEDLGRLGDYRVLGVLGRGGMGVVFRAFETTLHREVAVKVMLPAVAAEPTARSRFIREARSAATVEHPRVVPIYHIGEAGDIPFIVMPLLKGRTLTARVQSHPTLAAVEVLRIGREVAEGLAAAHDKGLVHRDLKPDNIWLEEGPNGPQVRLLDFGVARSLIPNADSPQLTQQGVQVGTPTYMSPEQALGRNVDSRTDLWSLGVILYELTAGRRPFTGDSVFATFVAILEQTQPPLHESAPNVPAALAELVDRLLAKDPAGRPGSAGEVVAELRRIEMLGLPPAGRSSISSGQLIPTGIGQIIHLPPAGESTINYPPTRTPPPRRRWRQVVLGAAVAVLAGLCVWLATRTDRTTPPEFTPNPDVGQPPKPYPSLTGPIEPIRVKFIRVNHFAMRPDIKAELKGVLGRESFGATLGDYVTVEVDLSRSAYCYLVAFRPDGVAELIFPENEGEAPPLTDRPCYPSKSQGRRYALDRDGLWVFAVAFSDQPLPPYQQAMQGKAPPEIVGKLSRAWTVWWHDGRWTEGRTAAGDPGWNAAGDQPPGQEDVVRAVKWLKDVAGPASDAAAIGFLVSSRN